MDKMTSNTALELLRWATSEDRIVEIMAESGYDDKVCDRGMDRLGAGSLDEEQLIAFFERTKTEKKYTRNVYKNHLHRLTLKGMDRERIFYLLKMTDFDRDLVSTALGVLDLDKESEESLTLLLRHASEDRHIQALVEKLQFDRKTDPEILDLLERFNYYQAAPELIDCLREEKSIKQVLARLIKRRGDYEELIIRCLDRLPLADWTAEKVIEFLEENEYNPVMCVYCLALPALKPKALYVISKAKRSEVTVAGMAVLDSDEDIVIALGDHRNWFDAETGIAAIRRLKSQVEIMKIVKGHPQREPIIKVACEVIDLALKTEAEIFEFLIACEYHYAACEACAPFLKPAEKDEKGLTDMFVAANFDGSFCLSIFEYLGWKNKPDAIVMNFLKYNSFQHDLVRRLLPFVNEEANILDLVKRVYFFSNFSIDGYLAPIFKRWSDDKIVGFVRECSRHKSVSLVALKWLKSRESVLSLASEHKYEKEISEAAAKRLKVLAKEE